MKRKITNNVDDHPNINCTKFGSIRSRDFWEKCWNVTSLWTQMLIMAEAEW